MRTVGAEESLVLASSSLSEDELSSLSEDELSSSDSESLLSSEDEESESSDESLSESLSLSELLSLESEAVSLGFDCVCFAAVGR
jgi:hypothetical protein